MGPTVFTAVCSVSGGEVVMETGSKTVSTLPKVWGSYNLSCSVHGSANPRVQERRLPAAPHLAPAAQYGVKRLYPPLYKLACWQKQHGRCERGLSSAAHLTRALSAEGVCVLTHHCTNSICCRWSNWVVIGIRSCGVNPSVSAQKHQKQM